MRDDGTDETDDLSDLSKEEYVQATERICAEPKARRELLWLRAMEKEDIETVRFLERVDRSLAPRMRALVEHTLPPHVDLDRPRERSEYFGRLYSERFAHHARRLLGLGPTGRVARR
jgi:hypothetical protein